MNDIVYAVTNSTWFKKEDGTFLPLIKIGSTSTERDGFRTDELFQTGVPMPFRVITQIKVREGNAKKIEKYLRNIAANLGGIPMHGREFVAIEEEKARMVLHDYPDGEVILFDTVTTKEVKINSIRETTLTKVPDGSRMVNKENGKELWATKRDGVILIDGYTGTEIIDSFGKFGAVHTKMLNLPKNSNAARNTWYLDQNKKLIRCKKL